MNLEPKMSEEERIYETEDMRIGIKIANGQLSHAYASVKRGASYFNHDLLDIHDLHQLAEAERAIQFIKDQLEEKGTK